MGQPSLEQPRKGSDSLWIFICQEVYKPSKFAKRGGKTPLKLKNHHKRCTLYLFQWEALCAELLLPTYFFFGGINSGSSCLGDVGSDPGAGFLNHEAVLRSPYISPATLEDGFYSPSSPRPLCSSCFQAHSLPEPPILLFNKSRTSSAAVGSRDLRQNPPIFTLLRPQEAAVLELGAFPT